ncbi:MAG: MarC family protein [Maritimibacter sp.]|nr:MarC family protein [Maritimibacter sp.]
MDTALFIRALGAFFAIMNPFVMLPVFLAMTADDDPGQQRRLGLAVAGFSALLAAAVMLAGSRVLAFFGISVDDFRVAGGIVLFTIALGMLNGTASPAHHGTAAEKAHHGDLNALAFYPMAFPMIVGPGTIATILVLTAQADPGSLLAVGAAAGIVLVTLALVLAFAAQIGRVMSQSLRVITMRLMGMILAAVAVDMTVTGLKALLPGLG